MSLRAAEKKVERAKDDLVTLLVVGGLKDAARIAAVVEAIDELVDARIEAREALREAMKSE